ncbi:MAG: DMT family transporter [Alphaproteobacteria bacterium]|nr:DMT family transporter [Alphaproteobacteria bacterium]MBV8548057.1 DMT family transporter [Alphaproteobacteria bacterium]
MNNQSLLSQGMRLSVFAYAVFAVLDMLIKLASANGYPPWQLLLTVCSTAALTVTLFAVARKETDQLRTQKPIFHFCRAMLNVGSVSANTYALTRIPLPDFYSIVFLGPLVHVLLGIILLKEGVRPQRWVAIIFGFSGSIAMLPFASSHPLSGPATAYYVCLLQPLLTASGNLLIKKYGGEETKYAFPLYTSLTIAFCMAFMTLAGGWKPFITQDLLMLIAAGVLSGVGITCLMLALQKVPPAFVSPFQYTQMIWGVLFGYIFWHYVPSTQTLVGAVITMVSGYYLFKDTRDIN